jgi:hypothetical protein
MATSLYVDGHLEGTDLGGPPEADLPSSPLDLSGCSSPACNAATTDNWYFVGDFGVIRIYKRDLSADEVKGNCAFDSPTYFGLTCAQ